MRNLVFILFLCAALAIGLTANNTAQAQGEYYAFDTAAQEALYNKLTKELRCPKCQNQTIADSDAPLAADMRQRVHAMVVAGDSYDDVIDFMKVRYGDFVHYKPPVNSSTIVLWVAPFVVVILGGLFILVQVRTQKEGDVELTAEEEAQFQAALNKSTQQGNK